MSVIRNGTGAPNNGVGFDGDYWIDISTGTAYRRASGTYAVCKEMNVNSGSSSNITGLLYGNGSTVAAATAAQIQAGGFPSVTRAQRDALSVSAGYIVWNNEDGWYDYLDSFWGWMPIGITAGWTKKYGIMAIYSPLATNLIGGFPNINNGTGSGQTYVATASGRIGVQQNTGSATTGRAGYANQNANGNIQVGTGRIIFTAYIEAQTLSNATDRYQVIVGFHDFLSANQVDGIYFLYDEGGVSAGSAASGNWQVCCSSNSVRSFTTTSVTYTQGQGYKLEIRINDAGTSVGFYINDVLVKTETNNIPTGSARLTSFGMFIVKSAGTTSRSFIAEEFSFMQKFTTSR